MTIRKRYGLVRVTAKMLAVTTMLAVMLLLAVGPAKAAPPVILLNADGIWSNACGASGCGPTKVECLGYYNTAADVTDENQVRYGDNTADAPCPSDKDVQSGFGFDGESNVAITPGVVFKLGTFTHYNNPIYVRDNKTFEHVDLAISMDFQVVSSGDTFTGNADYTMNLDETANGASPCEYEDPECGPSGCPNDKGCCDRVWFDNAIAPQVFEIDGVWYTLEIVGFVPGCTGDAADAQASYFTREQDDNIACLYGKIVVAAPSIKVTKTADPTSLPVPGGAFTFDVEVCNTGNADLELTSLVDDVYGDLNGKGTCTTGEMILVGECYECSFTVTETHETPWSQVDTVTATGEDADGHVVTDIDDAQISVTGGPSIPSVTQWGVFGMIGVMTVAAVLMLRRKYTHNVE